MRSSALALGLPGAQAAHERTRERELEEQQQQQPADQDGREREPDALAAGRHRAVALVGLEQQPPAVGCANREVDLEKVAAAALVAVLGARQVAARCRDAAVGEDLALVGAEREPLADQGVLVGVGDAPARGPQLDPCHRVVERVAVHGAVEPPQGAGVAAQRAGRHARGDDALSGHPRDHPGLVDRLRQAALAQDQGAGDSDHHHRREAGQRERQHDVIAAAAAPPQERPQAFGSPAFRHAFVDGRGGAHTGEMRAGGKDHAGMS